MMKPLDLRDEAAWKARYRAATVPISAVAIRNPAHGLIASNATGVFQLYAWNTSNGQRRQITDIETGKVRGAVE